MKRIDSLTPEQRARFDEWADMWIERGLRTGPADRVTFERAARACYRHAGLAEPKVIVWCQSPIVVAFAGPIASHLLSGQVAVRGAVDDAVDDAVRGAVGGAVRDAVDDAVRDAVGGAVRDAVRGAVRDAWYRYIGGQFWLGWQAYTSFFRDVCGLELQGDTWQRDKDIAEAQASACWWWPHKDFIMVSERPSAIHREQVSPRGWGSHRLHCSHGPAVSWEGWAVYAIHGIRVPAWLVETPAEQLDPREFAKIENVEIRREFIRKVGVERLTQKLGSTVLDRMGDYELHSVPLGGATGEWPYLKMRNPSIGVWHMEAVARECRTVQEALNWRNGGPLVHIAPLT